MMGWRISEKNGISMVTFDGLSQVRHGFSTREGGVSPGYCASLNFTVSTGDSRENVIANYEKVAGFLGMPVTSFCISRQTHDTNIFRVGRENAGNGIFVPQVFDSCDGMVTDDPGIVLVTFYADCVPVMVFDPVRHAVGAAHCGWRGTAAGMAGKLIDSMAAEFGSDPGHIRASVGPGIGKCCFETHGDVPEAILGGLGSGYESHIETLGGGRYKVDLAGVNRQVLLDAGISAEHIDVCGLCTCCHPELFHSHRRTGLERGSMAAFITCREQDGQI